MQSLIQLINQIFEIAQKAKQENVSDTFERNFNRIHHILESEEGLFVLNPLGEKYAENRTDYEANIVGKANSKMTITKVIKPIIYKEENGLRSLVQKGIVIAE